MTETDRQLHIADDDGFIDRRPLLEVKGSLDADQDELQMQIEAAEWEGMGVKTTPNKGESLRASVNRANSKITEQFLKVNTKNLQHGTYHPSQE